MKTSPRLVIAAVMASAFMISLEATIVATAMPQVVSQLGGIRLYSWVFSAYLLAQTAMTLVLGNLADIYGRKPVVLFGIAIFLTASLLAGFSWSMTSMICFRLVQGIGAGAVQPVAMTIVADFYPAAERGKIQGYLASVWAISAILGPIVGSLIVAHWSWGWIFWVNIPIGVLASTGFVVFLHEERRDVRRSLDVAGTASFTVAISAFLFALTEIGSDDHLMPLTASVCLAAAVIFIRVERRAIHPMISFELWSRRPIAVPNGVAGLAAMVLMGLTTFLPIYTQAVLRRSAMVAGLTLTMLLVGWPLGATLAARALRRLALRRIFLAGSVMLPAGASVLLTLGPQSSPVSAGIGSLAMGLGMGLIGISSIVFVQGTAGASQRGRATASYLFSRNLGSTLGAAALGAVFNLGLSRSAGSAFVNSDQLRGLLSGSASLDAGQESLRLALQQSLNWTFRAMVLISLAMLILATFVPTAAVGDETPPPAS